MNSSLPERIRCPETELRKLALCEVVSTSRALAAVSAISRSPGQSADQVIPHMRDMRVVTGDSLVDFRRIILDHG